MKRQRISIVFHCMVAGIFFTSCNAVAALFHGPQPAAPPIIYTVTFDANGASGTAPSVHTVNDISVINLPDRGGLSKTGYVFAGWNENADGSGTTFSVGMSVIVDRDMVFYARWLDESTPQYTVTFNTNGAAGDPPASQTVFSGVSITIPNRGALVYSGAPFGGWNTQANGEGTNYLAGALFTVTENITLYAIWNVTLHFQFLPYILDGNTLIINIRQSWSSDGTKVLTPDDPECPRFYLEPETAGSFPVGWWIEESNPMLTGWLEFSAEGAVTYHRSSYRDYSQPYTLTGNSSSGTIQIPGWAPVPYVVDGITLIWNLRGSGDGTREYTPDDPECPKYDLEPGTAGTFPIGVWKAQYSWHRDDKNWSSRWYEFTSDGNFILIDAHMEEYDGTYILRPGEIGVNFN